MSHSRRDAPEVDRVVAALERAGHDVWVDRADIVGGAEWQERIVRAIKDTDVFVIALSPDSVASPEVRRELAIADRERKPVVPVALRPVDVPDALEYALVNLQRIDLSGDFDLGVRRLRQAIGELGRRDLSRDGVKVPRIPTVETTGGRRRASARTAAVPWAVGGLLAALARELVDPAGQKVWLRRHELERLKASGRALATRYVEMVKNPSLSVNGRHPFRIITEWRDPATHELRLFYSENLWFDPTRHVELSTITVFVDPHDPSSYLMDVSFLPKVR